MESYTTAAPIAGSRALGHAESLAGLIERAQAQIDYANDLANVLEALANRVCGHINTGEPQRPSTPQPVANGLLEELNFKQGELQNNLSRIVDATSRLNEKL